jgi:hypothetical protein
MKALLSLIALLFVCVVGLFAWQYSIDPRYSDGTAFRQLLGGMSRSLFGERCRTQYKITTRSDAMEYARLLLTIKSMTWRFGGDVEGYELALSSEAFRSEWPSNKIRDGNGWVVRGRNEGIDYWAVSYLFADAVRSIHMYARFTTCRRILATENVRFGNSSHR